MARKCSTPSAASVRAALLKHKGNVCAAARELGVPRTTMIGLAARANAPGAGGGNVAVEASSPGGGRTVSVETPERVETREDAVRVSGVDLAREYVHRWEVTRYEGMVKLRRPDGTDEMRVVPMCRVWLDLRPVAAPHLLAALEALPARLAKGAPKRPALPRRKRGGEPCLLVLGLHDAHFGKYAWGAETGDDYDLAIADRVWRDAVAELLDEVSGGRRHVAEVLFPLGSDFLHVDNNESATNRGTRVDSDGRLAKVVEVAFAAFVWAAEEAAAVAPVVVPWVGGNHDRVTSHLLAREVRAWFRHAKHVTVDVSPRPRKYRRFGCNLVGVAHGDQGKPERLAGAMATENVNDMAGVTCREMHLGHKHVREVQTINGVVLRTLPSLSGCDSWHAAEAYVGAPRAAEAYLYGRDTGYRGHWVAPARS